MSYLELKGVLIGDDDPNDQSKIPQYATDLRFPELSLELRMSRLTNLAQTKCKLKDIELNLILTPTKSEPETSVSELRKKLRIIRTRIDHAKLEITCELKSCAFGPAKIAIYESLCAGCLPKSDQFNTSILYDLATLRNLMLRLSFLEEKISSSLSNQLTKDELYDFINESDKITKAVK